MTTKTQSTVKAVASKAKIGVLTLALMNVTMVFSLRGLPTEAEYGLTSVFYYIFAAVCFLIPVSLVAAELGTGWPKKGGVFRWIGEAFGPLWGWVAIYLQWLAVTVWFPTVLMFGAVALAFMGTNETWDAAFSANKIWTLAIVLIVYWAATLIAFRGVKSLSRVSSLGGLIGTIIPGFILIILGFIYYFSGHTSQVALNIKDLFPDFTNFNNLVLAASIFLFYAGMEINAVHVEDMDNPARNYPIGIFIATAIIVTFFVLGTLSVALIVPSSQINLVQSLLVTYDDYMRLYHMEWLGTVFAAALAIGVLAQVTVAVGGPSTGLLAVGKAGYLPPALQKTNAHGVSRNILLLQGIIVSVLTVTLVVLPSVQGAYQILGQMASIIYLLMYMLMFAAAIYLRRKEPNKPRPYKVPGGSVGMWIVAGVGFLASLLATVLSFVPPSQIPVGSPFTYEAILIVGTVVFLALPLIVYRMRRPDWKTATGADAFEPFDWETPATAAAPKPAAAVSTPATKA